MKAYTIVDRFCAYAKALSEPTRMKMVKILGSHEPETLKVGDIAEILNISQPAATKHLQIMEQVGIFTRKRIGTSVYYSLNEDSIEDFVQLFKSAYAHVFTPCNYNYDCDSCPYKETCN
ncbi:MAG: ArsR/SmtB family transcription factor [Anaerotardibacter sp.]